MKFYEFGEKTAPVILLLPGTCCHWKLNFGEVIPLLEQHFHVVCVSYDGFDDTEDTVFPDMIAETAKIEAYIQEHFAGTIRAAYGCSLGGSFVGLLVQRQNIHIDHAILGSSDLDRDAPWKAKLKCKIAIPLLHKIVSTGEYPKKEFHVIVVAYDGFNPTEPDTKFVSVMDEAKRLGDYIAEHHGGKIDILYALSYGCRVLLEVLADERLTITTTIADGMSTHDYPNIKSKLGREIYLFFFTGFFYQMMGKAGPIRKKLIARLTGRKPEEAERLLYPDATWQSWKNQDACLIGRPMNVEVFRNTDMHIWHGINSQVERRLAKDIQQWQDAGYAFTYKAFLNVGHGGLIAEHTEQFIEEVKAVHAASPEREKR